MIYEGKGVEVKRKRVLLDCDGILADYCTACFNLIEHHTGEKHTHDEVVHWDLFTILGKGHLKPLMKEVAAKSGWCLGFPVYDGAQSAVKRLEESCEVVIVTSPMTTPYWSYERTVWLEQHFGIPKGRIVHTEGKQYVQGDVLIDDSEDNCFKWHAAHPSALTLLWDAPYNREVSLEGTGIVRVRSWDEAFEAIERHET